MMIAVPLRENRFSTHFGGAEAFALYSVDEATREVSQRQDVTPPEHGRGVFPMWLRQQGATVILAGGMGPRASNILAQHGIAVMLGVAGEDPDTVVQDFLAGTLETTGELCHEHSFHDCGHHSPGPGRCGDHHD
jgi:predicted Fe-Mo cluster-binding NifX family protein